MDESAYIPYGRHIMADLFACPSAVLNDRARLEAALREAAIKNGATVLDSCSWDFQPTGVTVLLLLAESHVSIHTYPEDGAAFFDAFTCGSVIQPIKILEHFGELCSFSSWLVKEVERSPPLIAVRSD